MASPAAALLYHHRPNLGVALYGTGLILMFGVSSAYHLLPVSPALRRRLRVADQVDPLRPPSGGRDRPLPGWLLLAVLPGIGRHLGAHQLGLLAATAVCYSLGSAVLFTRRPDPLPHLFGYHEIWHAAVVAASACYFLVVWALPAGSH